jgi:lipid-binding SYLF domain-containing protein
MKIKILLYNLLTLVFIFSFSQSYSLDQEELEAKQILQSSELSLKKLIANSDLKNLKKFLKDSRAILIFPKVYEGGFIFGAKGGNGLLIIRRGNNKFSGPFFFSIGGVSVGLQVGAKSGKVVMTVMTNRGLKSILKERVKLGVDIDVALISQGVGYSAESTPRLADVYSFSDNAGLFVGGSLEGTYLQPRNDINEAFHKKRFISDDILNNSLISKDLQNLSEILNRLNDR